jgi:prevent-host-death family protein
MAREVQASEAETHLHQLLDEVEQGETIVITRDGRAVARIVPERICGSRKSMRRSKTSRSLAKQQAGSASKKSSLGVTQVISIYVLWRPWMRRSPAPRTPKWCCCSRKRGVCEGWLTPPTDPATEPPPRHPMVPLTS